MIRPQNAHKIQERFRVANSMYLHWRVSYRRDYSHRKDAREERKRYFRSDRQLTKQDLKLLARGNPWLEERDIIEDDDITREFKLCAAEREQEAELRREIERDWQEADMRLEMEEWDQFDDDFDENHPYGSEPCLPGYADEDAFGLRYSHVDEDDSLMR